ncbi:TPA: hypothetical protein QDA96_003305 [Burkholderia vietnamiensis]|uniref:hypothetical protein n=1 Tax=Burkholderia TaxID=32008 RepID=UPI00117FA74B|nr:MULTISPECIES: hypothetical protein [Burkholderia]MBR8014628.1 hypothetical protein [Burkholderia vietnamiensis]MBU9433759.1 hypothetical protein [Burkholderia multivorans]HDR9042614.1 hypothetical protein [Burkholderia vietnamiensis]HDR9193707.1 hypothetical protein [Burkholderia vietnamiensis]
MGMSLDWDLVSKLLFPIITALVVAAIGKRMENRPKVVTYMAHAAGFNLPPTQAPQLSGASDQQDSQGQPATTQPGTPGAQVNVHSIIVRNTGKKTAFNVRLGHNLRISHYVIEPPIQHESKVSDTGGWEILVPALVPNEQIMVSYLYFPPLTWHQINSYTKSDEGIARYLNVFPTPQPPKWLVRSFVGIFYIGVLAISLAVVVGVQWINKVTHLIGMIK